MTWKQRSVVRAITLLKLLAQSPESVSRFLFYLDVDVRTIRRDVRRLQVVGFPIVLNRDFCRLELVSDYGVPPLNLSEREVLATLLLFQYCGRRLGAPLFSEFRSAAAKIFSSTSPVLIESLETSISKVTLRGGAIDFSASLKTDVSTPAVAVAKVDASGAPTLVYENDADSEDWKLRRQNVERNFEAILRAAVAERSLAVQYKGPLLSEFETTFHPYATFFSRAWYAVGFSSLHREVRTFKVSRFAKIEESKEKFRVNKTFSLDAYFGLAWRFIRGSKIWRVVVRFSPKVGANVAEVCWHKTQRTRFFNDGTAELTFDVAGLNEIIWWILGYGAEAEVLEPPELRAAVVDVAKRMLAIYSDDAATDRDNGDR